MDRNPIKPRPLKLRPSKTEAESLLRGLPPQWRDLVNRCAKRFSRSSATPTAHMTQQRRWRDNDA